MTRQRNDAGFLNRGNPLFRILKCGTSQKERDPRHVLVLVSMDIAGRTQPGLLLSCHLVRRSPAIMSGRFFEHFIEQKNEVIEMSLGRVKTRVIMDSGKEYIFDEPLERFLKRLYDETRKKEVLSELGMIRGSGFSISVDHVSSLEEFE